MMTITVAEVLAALAAGSAPDTRDADDAHTGEEIRRAMGWSYRLFTRHMTALKAAGQLEVVQLRREDLSGRMQTVPGYRLLAPAMGKRR